MLTTYLTTYFLLQYPDDCPGDCAFFFSSFQNGLFISSSLLPLGCILNITYTLTSYPENYIKMQKKSITRISSCNLFECLETNFSKLKLSLQTFYIGTQKLQFKTKVYKVLHLSKWKTTLTVDT